MYSFKPSRHYFFFYKSGLFLEFSVSKKGFSELNTFSFQIFSISSDFLHLDIHELTSILSDDNLNVTGEDYVFWAIMRWVEHDPDTRQQHLPNLLRCIRFGLCNPQ